MDFLASRDDFPLVVHDRAVFRFGKNLWLAATANYEAMHNPNATVTVVVSSDSAASELGKMVIDYARTAFGLTVHWDDRTLVWPNKAAMTFAVTSRNAIRGDQPALTAPDEIRA